MKIKENEKRDKYLDLAKELKKLQNMEVTVIPIVIGALRTIPKDQVKRFSNKKASEDYPNYSVVKIGQNSEKSPGDLRKLAVTQTPEKDHQLTLV